MTVLTTGNITLAITALREVGTAIQEISRLIESSDSDEQLQLQEDIEARMNNALTSLRKAVGKDEDS